jgi:hypothetical protein
VLDFVFRENLRGLYRGLAPALVGVLPYSAIYMPSYEFAAQRIGAGPVAGAFAGLCGSIVKGQSSRPPRALRSVCRRPHAHRC